MSVPLTMVGVIRPVPTMSAVMSAHAEMDGCSTQTNTSAMVSSANTTPTRFSGTSLKRALLIKDIPKPTCLREKILVHQ